MNDLKISNVSIPVKKVYSDGLETAVLSEIRKILGTGDFRYQGLLKKSIDARRKTSVRYILTVHVSFDGKVPSDKNITPLDKYEYTKLERGSEPLRHRPLIAGSGPSGIFCAYILAMYGFRPIVIERGCDIRERRNRVRAFWSGDDLDLNTNVQFGEGGAGTFSDGKLVTRINDSRCRYVLEKMVEAGADPSILYEAKPHIGTDRLVEVIFNLREDIKKLGGTFLFNSKLSDINTKDGFLESVVLEDGTVIGTKILVAAVGHSARDTYEMLLSRGIAMEQKPFSAGVRIEHLQEDVNRNQWGSDARYMEEAAEYSASLHMPGRNVYTFCMCPGGTVVNASSEEGLLTVNGMSYSNRDGKNANCAWVAEVGKKDFHSSHPLAGIELQRSMEAAAFRAGGKSWNAPVQKLGDFLKGEKSSSYGRISPSFTGRCEFSDLNEVLPSFIQKALRESIRGFSQKLTFFNDPDAVLTGCETRTSSPVRIIRDANGISPSLRGLYPAGEGAGYAGGIMSAAVDGIKVAEELVKRYNYLGKD